MVKKRKSEIARLCVSFLNFESARVRRTHKKATAKMARGAPELDAVCTNNKVPTGDTVQLYVKIAVFVPYVPITKFKREPQYIGTYRRNTVTWSCVPTAAQQS